MSQTTAKATSLAPLQLDVLRSEYDNMLACVRCGACLTSCPTYVLSGEEAEGPRGRVAMMRALAEGHLDLTADLVAHEQNCLVCDACTAICPAGIHMDPMQVALRTSIDSDMRRPWPQRSVRDAVFRKLFPNMDTFRTLVRLLGLYQGLGLQWLARNLGVLRLLGLAKTEAFLPKIARSFLIPKGETYAAEATPGSDQPVQKVSFFAGCVMSTALADVDRATIRVLQRANCEVVNTAGQGCCGALNAHGGDLEMARELARRNIAAFEADGDAPIVVNSAGCGAMLKDYAHHLRDDREWADRARAFTKRVKDASEFLATRTLPMRRPLDQPVAYQDACHLAHAQRIRQQPRALLQAIPGLQLCELAEPGLCCGSAGIYNVTNPTESRQLQERKVKNIEATGAPIVATGNPGCLIQVQSGLKERGSEVRVKHLMELLDEATAP
jgi:glycolate oxidase iron-sulfur subunit